MLNKQKSPQLLNEREGYGLLQHKHCPPRPFLHALVYERDGDLNLSWLFVFVMGLVGALGFFVTVVLGKGTTVFEKVAAWSFLGASFASVLISAIPIAKAKILASSKLPGEVAHSISESAREVTVSTDLEELSGYKQFNEIG